MTQATGWPTQEINARLVSKNGVPTSGSLGATVALLLGTFETEHSAVDALRHTTSSVKTAAAGTGLI
ncbi:MAG: hypothetical protein KC668_15360, partial [Myxococcales bacterium]|nr:hypothetical protein [Myxococcales bacterium]